MENNVHSKMNYYFKNVLYRNIHVYHHDIRPELEGTFIIAFQTNRSNTWYYLNDKTTIGQMTQATKARRFENPEEAYNYMQDILHNLEFQGIELIKA